MSANNIVLIEDDDFFAKIFQKRLEKLLTDALASIYIFNSVEDAKSRLKEINPQILFLDHHLSGQNGIDAIPDLASLAPKAEIVVVSSQPDTSEIDRALKNGATRYFRKDVLLMQNAQEVLNNLKEKKGNFSAFWSKF